MAGVRTVDWDTIGIRGDSTWGSLPIQESWVLEMGKEDG